MLNPERIMQNFKDIDEALEQLSRLKNLSLYDFLSKPEYRYIAYGSFIIMIESFIDICYHVAVKKFKLSPASYAECFELLKRKEVLPMELAEKLSNMAKFRNLLIHRYKQVDFSKVYEYMKELDFIEEFKDIIKNLITHRGKSR